MAEQTLAVLNPLHFVDQCAHRVSTSQGLHGSFFLNLPHVSRSPELSRAYQIGDPVRLIDWKAFARNDQLIVREEKNEAMANVVIALDGRETMHWPHPRDNGNSEFVVSKFSFATRIALHLVHRHVRLGDRVRLVLLGDALSEPSLRSLELRSSSHILSLFEELEKEGFSKNCLESFLEPSDLFYPRTQMLFWISDCCDGSIPEDFQRQVPFTVLFHTLSSRDLDASWLQDKRSYFDASKKRLEFLGSFLKRKNPYSQKIQDWCKSLKTSIEARHGSYVLFTDKSSIRSYIAALDTLI